MKLPFRRRKSAFDRHVDQALAVSTPTAPRLVLDDVDVAIDIAELAVAWELPSYRRPQRVPPISPGPSSLSTEEC